MDAETYIQAGTQVLTSFVQAGTACVQLCLLNQRRIVLILCHHELHSVAQPVQRGTNIDPTVALPAGISLPLSTGGDGTLILTLADHGPLVQSEWWGDLEAGPGFGTWSIIEVIDLQLPCGVKSNKPVYGTDAFSQAPPTGGSEAGSFNPLMFGD